MVKREWSLSLYIFQYSFYKAILSARGGVINFLVSDMPSALKLKTRLMMESFPLINDEIRWIYD